MVVARIRPRVLVVDDEPLAGELVQRALHREYDVTAVQDGDDALALIHGGASYAAILCDLSMPGTGGVGLFREVTAHAPAQAARILFVTGGAIDVDTSRFLEAMKDRVLLKPFDRLRLLAAVATTVAKG